MKVATWNVNGIRARQAQFCEWVARERPDVVCLQELKAEPTQIPDDCKLEDYHVYWHGMKAYSGVALYVRKGLFEGNPEYTHPEFDMETRIVTAACGNLTLASVYVPNGGKDYPAKLRFFRGLSAWVKQLHAAGRELVLCGDMNIARTEIDVHPKERKPIIGQLPEERELFEDLLGDNLVDVGRAMHPQDENMFSWWAPWRNMRQRNIGWRLDYVLASKAIAARALSCDVLKEVGTSDHAPVMMATD